MQKSVIITGGSSGLGYETARQLAATGDWQVVIASRDPARTAAAATELTRATGHTVLPMQLDLASFDSARQFVAAFGAGSHPPLHAIVANAGITSARLAYTPHGIESTFGINHLGHFLLIDLLLPHLHEPARIVLVSSGVHIPEHRLARLSGVPVPRYTRALALARPEQADPHERLSHPLQRYSTAKLCNVLHAYELARRLDGREVGVFAIDPGLMPDTALVRYLPGPLRAVFRGVVTPLRHVVDGIRTASESGQHVARLVTDPDLAGRTALYFDGLRETRSSDESYDLTKARDLWHTSVRLTRNGA